jgi:hypothetical protein
MRKRMIDPSFWDDQELGKLDSDHRLLFISLISASDDHGRLIGDSRFLAPHCFKYHPKTTSKNVDKMLTKLKETIPNSLTFYEVNGSKYIYLTRWKTWQYIQKPQPSKLPPPPNQLPEPLPEPLPDKLQEPLPYPLQPNRIEKNRIEQKMFSCPDKDKTDHVHAPSKKDVVLEILNRLSQESRYDFPCQLQNIAQYLKDKKYCSPPLQARIIVDCGGFAELTALSETDMRIKLYQSYKQLTQPDESFEDWKARKYPEKL